MHGTELSAVGSDVDRAGFCGSSRCYQCIEFFNIINIIDNFGRKIGYFLHFIACPNMVSYRNIRVLFYRQLGCLAFSLRFWPKMKQCLSNYKTIKL